ncbi:DUF2796 domain-containing protein [Loktanella sp. DJP18]|uniref:DUF2796 domain-containing protein n=1 Tax=Loktanella sp. DJP18 TaxID=3409788 RepID=UPI003BB581B8
MKITAIALLTTGLALPVAAQEVRDLDAHVHGVSQLEVAIEGGDVTLDLKSPGMDIVGFEYPASTAADRDAVAAAIQRLLDVGDIVAMTDAAGCRLTAASARLDSGEHEHVGHDDHGDAHAEDDYDDHGDEHAADEEGAEHSAFQATYRFACDAPDMLTAITFPFFDQFTTAQEIEAQYVTDTGAGSAEIPRDVARLDLN